MKEEILNIMNERRNKNEDKYIKINNKVKDAAGIRKHGSLEPKKFLSTNST